MATATVKTLKILTDEQLAKFMKAPDADIDKLREHGCPTNADGTWNFVVVLAWIEQKLREHYTRKR